MYKKSKMKEIIVWQDGVEKAQERGKKKKKIFFPKFSKEKYEDLGYL
jgi:hypothetical protein